VVDLLHHSVLLDLADHWQQPRGHQPPDSLQDPRLLAVLRSQLTRLDPDRAMGRITLVWPPTPPENAPAWQSSDAAVTGRIFPHWFVCRRCHGLVPRSHLTREGSHGGWKHHCAQEGFEPVGGDDNGAVPVRFVVACEHGHLSEFPWYRFLHRACADAGQPACPTRRMRLHDAGQNLRGTRVECLHCGASRSLADAFQRNDALGPCQGERPWILGRNEETREACSLPLRPLVRTASNAWYSVLASSLRLPMQRIDPAVETFVRARMSVMSGLPSAILPGLWDTMLQSSDSPAGLTVETCLRVAAQLEPGGEAADVDASRLRDEEYALLCAPPAAPREGDGVFEAVEVTRKAPVAGVAQVVSVGALQEVRVQVGFTRLQPLGGLDAGGVLSRQVQLSSQTGAFPAVLHQGEGIFLRLDPDAVRAWERRPAVQARLAMLHALPPGGLADGATAEELPGARTLLVHTLSHVLMEQLGLSCGYSSTALRERLYVAQAGDTDDGMAGLLLITSTPGTDGTLGGLAEEAERIDMHLRMALRRATLCSNDPTCAAHTPQPDDPGDQGLGAACHACTMVAEPSCERWNRWLDRAFLVPVMGVDPACAFFTPPDGHG
jgi:hypothetical protein